MLCSKRTDEQRAGCPYKCGSGFIGRDLGMEDYLERVATNQVHFFLAKILIIINLAGPALKRPH